MSAIHGVNVGGNLFDVTDSSNVAPMQLTNFASRAYAKDRAFIMADGLLYRATIAIASGDPIVVNGNCKRTTLDEILSVIETDSDLIAPTEDGATSSADYDIGEQIVRSGILYKVIDDIAEGDSFAVGSNIEIAGTLTKQIQTLTQYANSQSNPNLLDNPWFTVNQRGQSSYTAAGYTVDRWKTVNSVGTMTVNVGGNGQLEITASSDVDDSAFIEQTAFGGGNDLYDKVVTLSLHDGNKIYSVTGQIPSTRTSNWQSIGYLITDDNVTCEYLLPPSSVALSGQAVIRIPKDGVARTIRAVKLELGSVSTLAMDTAPNYQQELAKCKRFYQRINVIGFGSIPGVMVDATNARIPLKLEPEMRTAPSVTISAVADFVATRGYYTDASTLSSLALQSGGSSKQFVVLNAVLTTAKTAYQPIYLGKDTNATDAYIQLHADL